MKASWVRFAFCSLLPWLGGPTSGCDSGVQGVTNLQQRVTVTIVVNGTEADTSRVEIQGQMGALTFPCSGEDPTQCFTCVKDIDVRWICTAQLDNGNLTVTGADVYDADDCRMSRLPRFPDTVLSGVDVKLSGSAEPVSPRRCQINVKQVGEGAGTVSSTPAGLACGPTCRAEFDKGSDLTLRPGPDGDSYAQAWAGPCSGQGDCAFKVKARREVSISYGRLVAISVIKEGSGADGGNVTDVAGSNINCGVTCQKKVIPGTSVALRASGGAGSCFAGWSGPCEGGYDSWCSVKVQAATVVRSRFASCTRYEGVTNNDLYRLWGSGANNVWTTGTGSVIRRWDGSNWSPVNFPGGGPSTVWGSGPNDVWVTGTTGAITPQLMYHWNGSSWTTAAAGLSQSTVQDKIWGTSSSDIWASGYEVVNGGANNTGLLNHWDGNAWTRSELPGKPVFTALWGASRSEYWACGTRGAYRWNGSTWTNVLGIAKNFCFSVWGSGPTDMWFSYRANISHWNGSTENILYEDSNPNRWILSIHGTGPTDAWAVGSPAIVMHWDGNQWVKIQPVATNFGNNSILEAVWAVGPGEMWTVGQGGVIFRYKL